MTSYSAMFPGHPILDKINLYAKPGQKIAFVGSTGAGKTTITNLINRFYEIDSGTITYDGIDIRDIRKGGSAPFPLLRLAGYPLVHGDDCHPLWPPGRHHG